MDLHVWMFTSFIHGCRFYGPLYFSILMGTLHTECIHCLHKHRHPTPHPPSVGCPTTLFSVLCTGLMFTLWGHGLWNCRYCSYLPVVSRSLGMDRYYGPSSRSHGNAARMTHQMRGSSFRFPVKFAAFVVAQHFWSLTHFGFYCRDAARMTLAFRG